MNTLTAFIREHREAIVDEWTSRAQQLPSARTLTRPALHDHLPRILDKLASAIDRRDETPAALENLPEQHASARFREGYDLRQVVAEYRLLREVVMHMYRESGDLSDDSRPKLIPLTVMHEAVDRAIADAVDQYAIDRDRVRDTFVAMLGHDLRDPLNTIVFSANTGRKACGELDARAADRIASSAARMERMIADLLDFARGRLGGGFIIVPTTFDVRALVERTVRDMADAHPDRAIHVAEAVNGDFQVEWDSDRITQVISNLVSNAILHGRDPVIVEPRDEGEYVSLHVCNSGDIPPDVLPRLFDAFSAETADRPRKGLGLGLYIVQQIAYAHGGDVSAQSADGTTTIRVRLPRRAQRTVTR